jgi:hypothetical protein
MDSSEQEFLGSGEDCLPRDLAIESGGVSMSVPAYTVAIFLQVT